MAMALRLKDCGHELHICDIDPERQAMARLAGMTVHPHAASLAADCSTILMVVLNAAQVKEVLAGAERGSIEQPLSSGLLSVIGKAHQIIFCSTVAPQDVIEACQAVTQTGASALDAPISGGPVRAAAGDISMMIAGPRSTEQALGDILGQLSSRKFYISSSYGDGARAKLVNNLLAAINLVGAAEAMALAQRLGLDAQTMLGLIAESSGASWMFSHRMPRALGLESGITAQTHVLTKDAGLANDMAGDQGLSLAMGSVALSHLQATCEAGWSEADDSSVFQWYRKQFEA